MRFTRNSLALLCSSLLLTAGHRAMGWQPVTNGLPSNPTINLLSSHASTAVLNVSSGSPNGVFASTNGGTSWYKTTTLPGSSQLANVLLVVGNSIYVGRNTQAVGTNAILRSTDFGVTWLGSSGISNNTSVDLLATDGTALFAGKSGVGTVWRSTDGGANWEPISSSSANFNFGTLRALGGSDGRAVAAASTGIYTLSGSGTNWTRIATDGNTVAATRMAHHDGKLFLLYGDLNRRALALPDGSTNLFNATNGLAEGAFNISTYRDFAASTNSLFISASLYAPSFEATTRLFQSTNAGTNWTETNVQGLPNSDPRAIAVISNQLFAAVSGSFPSGLYRVLLLNGLPILAPSISNLPPTTAVHPGVTIVFNPQVIGEGTVALQWRKNGIELAGETNLVLTLSNVTTNESGTYTLTASNAGGTNISGNAVVTVVARSPGGPNLDFQPGHFASDAFGNMVNATPFAVGIATNGYILVGGNFTHVNATQNSDGYTYAGGTRSQGIARLTPDGLVDPSFVTAPGIEAGKTVNAIALQSDGKIVIGGEFTSYNGIPQTNLTRINLDGSLDLGFATNAFNNGSNIRRIQIQSDGKIVVSGSFSTINGISRLNLARFHGDGALDMAWPAGIGTANANDLALTSDDQLLVGGSFGSVSGNTSRKYLALLDTAGAANTNFNHGLNSSVSDVELQPGGLIWASGFFTTYSNAPIPSVVRLGSDGGLVNGSYSNLNNAATLFSQEDGKLLLTYYNNATFNYTLARLNADGSPDSSFNGGTFSVPPQRMAMAASGDLYAVGTFFEYYGLPLKGLVKIYAASTNVPAQLPEFIMQPGSTAGVPGGSLILRGSVAGAAPLSFLWLKNGDGINGATNSVLSLTNISPVDLADYQLVASNSFGSVTSLVATVSAAAVPAITQNLPATTGSTNGGNVTLGVEFSGTAPFRFQWFRNGGLQFGLTNHPLTLTNLSAATTGSWHVIITNAYGSATSSVANVQIGVVPVIQTQPQNVTLNGEGNVTISVLMNNASSAPLTYLWYQNGNLVRAQATNSYLNSLVISNAVPTNGGSYQVIVTNYAGSVTSLVRTVTIRNPHLSPTPSSISAVQGVTTNLSVGAIGTLPVEFYWYRRSFGSASIATTNFMGTGSTLTFSPLVRSNGQFNYFVVASNVWGRTTSSLTAVTVQFPTAITNISSTNLVVELNDNTSFWVLYEAQPNPDIRWYKDGVLQPQLFSPTVFFNSVQASNSGSYQLVLSNFINSVTSAPIVLTVKPPRGPEITNQPPATRTASTVATLNIPVGVDGTPQMYYRWFRGAGTPVTGWTTAGSLYLTPVTTNDSGNYYVIVTNAYGSATSTVSAVTIIAPQPANFANKQFVKIADSLTTVPGLSPVKFHSFRDAFIRGGQVWFGGNGGNGTFASGVHHWNNHVLSTLVATNTLVPGTSSRFTNFFGSTFLSAGKVVFAGYGSGDEHGIYAWTNNSVITIHDKNTVIPGRTETFDRFGWPNVVGDQFAFLGFSHYVTNQGPLYRGVFISSNSVLTKLADTNSLLPGLGGHFRNSSSQVGFDGNTVAWWAWNAEDRGGIFTVSRALTLTNRADELTVNPASGQVFDGFISPPNVKNGRVYFVGHDSGFNSTMFYRDPNGPIQVVAKPGDTIPGRGMTFDSVGYPFQIGTTTGLFFDGQDGGGYTGIFYWNGSTIVKVIDSFDSLDGQAINYIFVGDAEGDDLVFYVGFTNGKQALYAMVSGTTGESFSQWATSYTFPPGQSDPEDDADGDGLKNAFEFYFGSNPTNSASGAMPAGASVNVSGQNYPAITFIRVKNAGGVTLMPQASSDVNFSNSLGTTIESVVDLGNGTERVTVRSTVNSATQATQFLRIQLSIP